MHLNRFAKTLALAGLIPGSAFPVWGQTTAQLKTTDTELQLEAGPSQPRLVSLQSGGQEAWTNRASEALIDHVEIGGQSTPLVWKFNAQASHVAADQVDFVYDSAPPHLRLTWEWKARAAQGPVEHRILIRNLTAGEMWLPLQDSFAFNWQVDPTEKLEQLSIDKGGGTPTPEGTHQLPVVEGSTWKGASSTYAEDQSGEIIPWLLVQRAGNPAGGWHVGIEFSGCTRLALARKGDSLSGAVGLNPDLGDFRTRLEPDGSFETPTIFLGGFTGSTDDAGNALRRWEQKVLINPATWKKPNYPLLANNSWGNDVWVSEALALRMIRDSTELGFDMFHVDAGWFRGVGDWYPDPKKFPHGLAAIADDAHRHGLKFGLWVDWSQAGLDTEPGALNVRDPQVRDWLTLDPPADWKPEPFRGITIDIGVPAAQAWAQREVNRIVRDYHLDMLEHDGHLVAKGCPRDDHPHAPPNLKQIEITPGSHIADGQGGNSTDVSYHAVRAYYEIQSSLRKANPDLLLEICNDGGRMVDFGSAAHGDYFSITDTYDPLSNRRAFHDTSYVLPAAMLECYVEKWPTPQIENFRSMIRSGMMGWLTIMLDTTQWTPEQHAAAKAEFQLYKTRLRPFIRDADLYHISPRPDGVHWDGIEYFDPRREAGVVYAFRGSIETESSHAFVLQGLQPDTKYHLHFQDGSSPDAVVSGSDLGTAGLTVQLPQPTSSELIFIDRARPDPAH